MSNMEVVATALSERANASDITKDSLNIVRTHLGMEIGYLSEFVDGKSVFREVDAPGLEDMIKPGDSRPLDQVYCQHILEGRLPELIPDTAANAFAAELPITNDVPIGAHVSVPIRRNDGSVYGMFCCLSPSANPTLNTRDLEMVRMFAQLVQRDVQTNLESRTTRENMNAAIDAVITTSAFKMVFQPIVRLADAQVMGFESLCRFAVEPYRTPDKWFADADAVGRGPELEAAAICAALDQLGDVPDPAYMSINAGPECVISPEFEAALAGRDLSRIVLELTEHMVVQDYAQLDRKLTGMRAKGLRLAIDDAGAGYSGLQHIVRLKPEIIKLDRSLVDGVDQDRVRRSLSAAMVHYSTETNALLVAEGIETEA